MRPRAIASAMTVRVHTPVMQYEDIDYAKRPSKPRGRSSVKLGIQNRHRRRSGRAPVRRGAGRGSSGRGARHYRLIPAGCSSPLRQTIALTHVSLLCPSVLLHLACSFDIRSLARLKIYGLGCSVSPSRYWLRYDSYYGWGGGHPFGNLIVMAQQATGGPGYNRSTYGGHLGSDGQTSCFSSTRAPLAA